jgi:hypothetical protein
VLVPGALVGLWLAIRRPRSRDELAFAAVTLVVAPALLAETAIFGAVDNVQERYVFYLVPLIAVAFALYAQRGWPLRRAHAVLVVALLTLSALFPLSMWSAADGKEHSPVLLAESRLEDFTGTPAGGAMVFAGVALLLCGVALVGSLRPRFGTVAAFGLAAACGVSMYAAASSYDRGNADRVADRYLPDNRNWIDDSGVDDVAVLRSYGSLKIDSLQLFWNRNVNRVLLMPGASVLDPFSNERVQIGRDGTLVADGEVVKQSLLVDDYDVTVSFTGARKVGSSPIHTLWRAEGTPRLSLYVLGRYHDGWLANHGGVNIWPAPGAQHVAGWFTTKLSAPTKQATVNVRFALPDGTHRDYRLRPGAPQVVRIAACADVSWQVPFSADTNGYLAGRHVSARASLPKFTPDPAACPGSSV